MILEIPEQVVLSDGSTADVKGVAARVVDGRFEEVVYTVERASGAWAEVAGSEARARAADDGEAVTAAASFIT